MRIRCPSLLRIFCILLASVPISSRMYLKTDPAVEDEFVAHFGNNKTDLKWDSAKNAHLRGNEEVLKNFSARAHVMAKKGAVIVNSVIIRTRILVFRNEKYHSRRVDVLSYGISGVTHPKYDESYWYMVEGEHGYLTQGKRPDCVYYLSLLNSFTMKFALVKHVCGIDVDLDAVNV